MSNVAHLNEDVLERYAMNRLSEVESEEVEDHIAICSDCLDSLDHVTAFVNGMRTALREAESTQAPESKPKSWFQRWLTPGRTSIPVWAGLAVAATAVLLFVNRPAELSPAALVTLDGTRGSSTVVHGTGPFEFELFMPAEGKSFTSANYALALAQQGYRVLLIDGDLRRPSLQKIFIRPTPGGNGTAEPEVAGVVDYLIGEITLANAVHPVAALEVDVLGNTPAGESTMTSTGGGLYVLTGGRRAPNPAELLSGNSFHQLVDEAAK